MADELDSGSSARKGVWVQLPSSALFFYSAHIYKMPINTKFIGIFIFPFQNYLIRFFSISSLSGITRSAPFLVVIKEAPLLAKASIL